MCISVFPFTSTLATQSVWSNLSLRWVLVLNQLNIRVLSGLYLRDLDPCEVPHERGAGLVQTQASIETAGALERAGPCKRGKQFVKLWVPVDDSPGVSPVCGCLVTLSGCAENSQHATGERPPLGFGSERNGRRKTTISLVCFSRCTLDILTTVH